MPLLLDHIAWGAADLDSGVALFESLTGVKPMTGGSHAGLGTRNMLAGLGTDSYFEIISVDPAQEAPKDGLATSIAKLTKPAVLSFMVQTMDIDHTCAAAEAAGVTVTDRWTMSRTRPDGVKLTWTVAKFSHPEYAGLSIPFAIDWQGSPHPSGTTPKGCSMKSLTVLHPQPAGLSTIYSAMGLAVSVQGGVAPGIVAIMNTPKGEVCVVSR